MPSDPGARARTKTWMFAALNTIEPPIVFLTQLDMQKGGPDPAQREAVAARVKTRLASLCDCLDGRDYLEEGFTASDLLMTSVLRILRRTDMVAQMPVLEAYRLRCEARPAFQKALADQMANFAANTPPQT
jgi:glutathione S-transferase